MAFGVPTIVGADNASNDTDYAAWVKVLALILAANTGQLSGFRNKLKNGAADVWQNGTSFATTTAVYTADQWAARRGSNAAGLTLSRQTGFSGARYCMRLARDAANAAADILYLGQPIETADAISLAGKTVRVSADIRAGANFSASGGLLTCEIYTGTGTDGTVSLSAGYSSNTTHSCGSKAISTTAARIEFDAVLLASGCTEAFAVFRFTPVGTAGAADYVELTNVQLEEVYDTTYTTTTPYERRPFVHELRDCQRYLEKGFDYATTPAQNAGTGFAAGWGAITAGATSQRSPLFGFRVSKRTAPTMTLYNPSATNAEVRDFQAAADCSSSAAANITEHSFAVNCTGNGSTAAGNRLGVSWKADARIAVS